MWTSLLAIVLIAALAPSPAGAATSGSSAEATSTILGIDTPLTSVSLGEDDAHSLNGSATQAFASLVSGRAVSSGATQEAGSAQSSASADGEHHSSPVGVDPVDFPGLLNLGAITGSVTTDVGHTVSSNVDLQLASAAVLDGLATLDGAQSASLATVGSTSAHVTRSLSVAELQIAPLRELLQALGANPLDLTCTSVEELGGLLGVDTTTACDDLSQIGGLVQQAVDALATLEADLLSQKDAVIAQIADLEAQIDAATALQASLNATLSDLQSQLAAAQADLASQESQLSTLQGELDTANATKNDLLAQQSALEAQTSGYTRATVQSDHDTVANMCAGLDPIQTAACEALEMTTDLPALATTYGIALPGTFDAAQSAVLDATQSILDAFTALDAVNAQLVDVTNQIDSLDAQITTTSDAIDADTAQIADLQSQIDATTTQLSDTAAQLAQLSSDLAAANALLDQIVADLDVIASSGDPATATCDATGAALASVSALIPASSATLDPIAAQLGQVCDDMTGQVNALIDTPLMTLDSVDLTVDALARADTPSVTVSGTIGSIQLGALAPFVVDLPIGDNSVPSVGELLTATIQDVVTTLGLDVPVPTFDFVVTHTATGHPPDGSWTANGSVTMLEIQVPAGTLTIPATPPLGVLANGTTLKLAGPRRAARLAGPSDPLLTLDVGRFDAAGVFMPASALGCTTDCGGGDGGGGNGGGGGGNGGGGSGGSLGGGNGSRLPRTGIDDSAATKVLALLLLAAAVTVRRFARR